MRKPLGHFRRSDSRFGSFPVAAFLVLLALLFPAASYSYSVLTHEAIIDSVWDGPIKQLLLQRFPDATPEMLEEAHSYAYGGCIMQDMGYYPFGSRFFSDLAHYVRSGDFVLALIRTSEDLNEYAFSLGALAHYAADENGHRMAINRAVPLLFPDLRRRFGNQVTYADDRLSHLQTEFAFDVLQVAQGHYAPDGYKHFIGFHVSTPVLQRAFQDTYSLTLGQVFTNLDLAIGSYRRSVGSIVPKMTQVAWRLKRDEIRKDAPSITRKKFLYNLSRGSYEKDWGKTYQRPELRSRFSAFLFGLLPKVGPWRALAFRTPTPETEKMFMASVNSTLDAYRKLLAEQKAGRLRLRNQNFDVGEVTSAGKYKPTDDTYAKLLDKLAGHHAAAPAELSDDILAYYHDLSVPISTKKDPKEWAKLLKELDEVKAARPADAPGATIGGNSLLDSQVSTQVLPQVQPADRSYGISLAWHP